MKKLTSTQINQALEMHKAGIPVEKIAERFDVTQQTVDNIIGPTERYDKKWCSRFCSAWDEARYLASGGRYDKLQETSHEPK